MQNLDAGNDDVEMPDFKPNNQKTKSFKKGSNWERTCKQ